MNITETVSYDKNGRVERFPLFRKLFLAIIIILLAILSFGIGRLTASKSREPVKIEYDPALGSEAQQIQAPITVPKNNTASAVSAMETTDTTVVVSRNGTKYHYLSCPGAQQIKEENKIVFTSPQAAEAAGYTLAANCKKP